MTKFVSKFKSENFRLQGTTFSFTLGSLLIVNTYFPCDPRVNNFDDNVVTNLLSDIHTMIRNYDTVNILVAGNMNCHFSRNTRFSNLVKSFFEDDLNFKIFLETPCDKINPIDYSHTFMYENLSSFSTIDHFVGNQNVINSVIKAGVTYYRKYVKSLPNICQARCWSTKYLYRRSC